MKRQSMKSQPIFTRMPATTARGIDSAYWPRPRTSPSRMAAYTTPETLLRAPARMLGIVQNDPPPGTPPTRPVAMVPIPWASMSRFEVSGWRIIDRTTTAVNRVSSEPMIAMTTAGWTA